MSDGIGDQIIIEHYNKVAERFGLSPQSTLGDQYIRNAEVSFFIDSLKMLLKDESTQSLFDIGCGNAHLLSCIRALFPTLKLAGMDFHPELVKLASSREIENCNIHQGDMRRDLSNYGQFDFVLTERSVINLLSKEEQYVAFNNIAKIIKPGGYYLFSESFEEPRANINRARKQMKLAQDVNPSKHNLWLREEDLEVLKENGFREIEAACKPNHLSTHFYITRILHSIALPKGGEASEFQNFFNLALPAAIGNYSPILFRAFVKSK
tara:strand:+ start:45496 stop:46293 length:798 start_codon:yes stop_codon:yes gene_type:complete